MTGYRRGANITYVLTQVLMHLQRLQAALEMANGQHG